MSLRLRSVLIHTDGEAGLVSTDGGASDLQNGQYYEKQLVGFSVWSTVL